MDDFLLLLLSQEGQRQCELGEPAQSLTRGSNSWNHEILTWVETKSQVLNWLSHPGTLIIQHFYILSLFFHFYKQQKYIKAANQSKSRQCFLFIKEKKKKQNQGTVQIFSQVCFLTSSVNNCRHQMRTRQESLWTHFKVLIILIMLQVCLFFMEPQNLFRAIRAALCNPKVYVILHLYKARLIILSRASLVIS